MKLIYVQLHIKAYGVRNMTPDISQISRVRILFLPTPMVELRRLAGAMGGLIDMIRNKEFSSGDSVLFWHTGGTPALFQYAKHLMTNTYEARVAVVKTRGLNHAQSEVVWNSI